MKLPPLKIITFVIAIILGIILQVLMYSIEPFSENGFFLQNLYSSLFYIPMLLILITFPRPTSIKKQILVINLLVLCLMLASMNVDFQVIRIFNLPDILPPEDIGTYVWDKTYNLYWIAWSLQWGVVFLIFALIYRFRTDDTWTSIRIGAVGPLIAFFSFEDIIYYPMHGENPFNISAWSWLPQHDIYFGRPINTVELIWIVVIVMTGIFFFLVIFAIRKQSEAYTFKAFPTNNGKRVFLGSIPIMLGAFIGFILLYLNTNIVNNQIPIYLLLSFVGVMIIFTVFSGYFPPIKSTFRQLVLIFACYILFWVAATEMDWHAVEGGFHWVVPSDPRKPPGDFWVWCDYRMAMWLIYLPITILLISVMFKSLGNSKEATIKLGITNYLILILGIDSILIFLIAGGTFPPQWSWSNIHYSILNGAYLLPVLIGFAVGIGFVLFYIHKRK